MKSPILYMAPMMGINNYIYRNLYSSLFKGYDYAVTPFLRGCKFTSIKSKLFKDIEITRNNNISFGLIPQILGNNAQDFICLAKAMSDLGYETVNWNLGCPHKRIRKKMRGSGLLSFPDKIIEFLNQVIPAIPNKVSIKVRLGNENGEELFALLPLLNDFSLKEIIIHPRIGVQMYEGEVDDVAFQKCLSLTKHNIVYNGDINSVEKFNYLTSRFPMINRWMIGRGGITNLFLAEEIKKGTSDIVQKKSDRFIEFHNELLNSYKKILSSQVHVVNKMKEYWFYWSKAFDQGDVFFRKLSKAKDLSKYIYLVENFLTKSYLQKL